MKSKEDEKVSTTVAQALPQESPGAESVKSHAYAEIRSTSRFHKLAMKISSLRKLFGKSLDAESIKKQAIDLFQKGKIDESIHLYEKLGNASYGDMRLLGNELMEKGNFEGAIQFFEKSRMDFPVDLVKIADCYYAMGNGEKAKEIDAQIENNVALNARMLLALHLLNGANGRSQDVARAENLFKTIASAYSKDVSLFGLAKQEDVKLGNICFCTPETYTPLREAMKKHLPAKLWMARLEARGNRPLEAIKLYQEVIEKGSNEQSADVCVQLGDLWRKGDVVGRVRDFDILMAKVYYVKAGLLENRFALEQLTKSPDVHMKALDGVSPGQEKEILNRELGELKKKIEEAQTICISELENAKKLFAAKAAAEKGEANKEKILGKLLIELETKISREALKKAEDACKIASEELKEAVEARKNAMDELKKAKQQIIDRGYMRLTSLITKSPESWAPADLVEEIERLKAAVAKE